MRRLSRRMVAGGGIATAAIAASGAWGAPAAADADLPFVDPELRPAARRMIAAAAATPPLSTGTLDASRRASGPFAPPPLAAPPFERRLIPGPAGAPDLAVYTINAQAGARRPAILHMHGGGFVMGDARGALADLQRTAAALDCVIVTVDYRLAPETGFAGSMEDGYAALRWLHDQAAAIGADPRRIAVMGESAGGGHAALLALTARDRGEIPLVLQVLAYPMLDDRTGTTRHPAPPMGALVWTAQKNVFGWRCFLGEAPGTPRVPARAVPARRADLAGLPPAFIGVGSIDLLADEDIDYARRLIDAGVATELLVVPGAYHAFDRIAPQTAPARRFTAARLDALRRAFATGG